jgi:hypothetical protein
MVFSHRKIQLTVVLLVLGAGVCLLPSDINAHPTLITAEEIFNKDSTVHCAIRSLYAVCQRLEVPAETPELEKLFPKNKQDISLYDIYIAAKKIGLEAKGMRVNYEALLRLKSPAIAFVNNNHFLVVEGAIDDKIRIWDYPKIPILTTQNRFEKNWNGEVLVISKPLTQGSRFTRISPESPVIRFDSEMYDFGDIPQDQEVEHLFKLTNEGSKTLEILKIQPSCSCISTYIKGNEIQSGKSREINLVYNSIGRTGQDFHTVIIQTNELHKPFVYLTIAANVKREYRISPPKLYFDSIPQSTEGKQYLTFFDLTKTNLKITRVKASHKHIIAKILPLQNLPSAPGTQNNLKIGMVEVLILPGLPIGVFKEKLIIYINSKTAPQVVVPVEGIITGDIVAFPNKLFFGLIKKGEEFTRTVDIFSVTKKKFIVEKVDYKLDPSMAEYSLCFTQINNPEKGTYYRLIMKLKALNIRERLESAVKIQTNLPEQSTIEIPIYAWFDETPVSLGDISETRRDGLLKIEINYFFSPMCKECPEVEKLLENMKAKFGDNLIVKRWDISNIQHYSRLIQFEEKYHDKTNAPVKLFVNDTCLAGKQAIVRELEPLIQRQFSVAQLQVNPGGIPTPIYRGDTVNQLPTRDTIYRLTTSDTATSNPAIPAAIVTRFQSFNLFLIASSGLLDGINPCAFTTIVFFISLLALVGKTKPELLTVGIFFTFAVFLTYLLLGLGALQVINSLRTIPLLRQILRFGIAGVAFIFAGFSLYDVIVYLRTKQTDSMTLQLPRRIKERIHQVMREKLKLKGLIFAAFTTGILVSLLESVCTGQVYLPTLVFMTKESAVKLQAYGYLLLYNLMFIIPLVIVFLLALFGVTSTRFSSLTRGNLIVSKSLLILLFLTLAAVLIITG